MKINKELIEKYHLDNCTQEERDAVEDWLFSENSEEELQDAPGLDKQGLQKEMWQEIETVVPVIERPRKSKAFYLQADFLKIAATLIFGLITFTAYRLLQNEQLSPLSINNDSAMDVRHVVTSGCTISLAPNTQTRLNYQTGYLALTGSMVIRPKKDIQLRLGALEEEVILKGGQTYIAFNEEEGNDKIIIVNERNLADIPPVLQRALINQFNI